MFYSQGNKKQGHQLRVSTVGVGVRGLRTEEKILKKSFIESGNKLSGER